MSNVKELNVNNTTYDIIGKGVVDQNNPSTPLKQWSGTKAQYDAIVTKDANTLYNITDDANPTITLLEAIYPVGSIYIGTMNTCPLATLFGTWTLVAADKVLQGAGTRGSVGTTVNESLPNIKGSIFAAGGGDGPTGDGIAVFRSASGAFSVNRDYQYAPQKSSSGWAGTYASYGEANFDANDSSSTYQDDAPVQQDAYLVNIWERTA